MTSGCTLQSRRPVTLNTTRLRMMQMRASTLAVTYTINDHLHGRFPVYTSHSKSRVVINSHLLPAIKVSEPSQRRENLHVSPGTKVDDFGETIFPGNTLVYTSRRWPQSGTNQMSAIRTPDRMASFTAIGLSSGSLESKRDTKETEEGGGLATRTIIIVPMVAFLSKSSFTWSW